jgi:hypothetical protein
VGLFKPPVLRNRDFQIRHPTSATGRCCGNGSCGAPAPHHGGGSVSAYAKPNSRAVGVAVGYFRTSCANRHWRPLMSR